MGDFLPGSLSIKVVLTHSATLPTFGRQGVKKNGGCTCL